MSGLAGLVALDGQPIARERLERMAAAAASLGPDGIGIWHAGPVGLVHLKLATTPESVNEQQPLLDEQAQLVITFDGRLDNRADLFRELGTQGSPAQEAGDSELALAMFKLRGARCPESFVGDYSLAIWDLKERRLFCARSLLGWRPFLWWCDGSTFAFSTEVKQLFAAGGIARRVNEPMLGEILALRMTHATETIWKAIYRLQPGCALSLQSNGPRIWSWHQGPFPELRLDSESDYAERFRELFDQAIKACLRSTTPVAVQLSGGLDSSSIVCRAAELYRKGEVDKLVQPISGVFPGRSHNESDWIDLVAAKSGLEPRRFTPSRYDWEKSVAWTRETLNLPLRPNAHLMDSLAAQLPGFGSRVLLTGEGGDDWLRGTFSHWSDLLRRGRLIQLLREGLILNTHGSLWQRIHCLAGNSLGPWVKPQIRNMVLYGAEVSETLPSWIRADWAKKIGLPERVRQVPATPRLNRMTQIQRYQRYFGIRHHVVYDNVFHSMTRNKLDIRHPFHDRRLTEFVLGLPGHLLRRGERKKHILREAMIGILPDATRERSTKTAFIDPFVDAIEEFLADRPIHELSCVKNGWVESQPLLEILEANQAAKRRGLREGEYPPSLGQLWFAISLDVWLRNAFGE